MLSTPVRNHRAHTVLAEDDPDMRALVAEALRKDGHDVEETDDGGRLLVTLARRYRKVRPVASIDLVVSDIRMPICTGLQILEQLRAAHWHVPVVLMTAFGDDALVRRASSLDALLFDKPFAVDDLRAAITGLLRRERRRPPLSL